MSINKTKFLQLMKLEKQRQALAKAGKIKKLEKLYKVRLNIKNENYGFFWDRKFVEQIPENLSFFQELDRNQNAATWYKSVTTNNMHTLNIGCGDGKFEKLIYEYVCSRGIKHVGIDMAGTTLDRLSDNYPEMKFKIADARKVLFRNNFSTVCMFEVLEHIEFSSTFSLLRRIRKLLSNDGHLLLSVPVYEDLESMYPYNPNRHMRMYTPELIEAELVLAGFSIEKQKEFIAFPSMYKVKTFLSKTLLKRRWKPNNVLIMAKIKTT